MISKRPPRNICQRWGVGDAQLGLGIHFQWDIGANNQQPVPAKDPQITRKFPGNLSLYNLYAPHLAHFLPHKPVNTRVFAAKPRVNPGIPGLSPQKTGYTRVFDAF